VDLEEGVPAGLRFVGHQDPTSCFAPLFEGAATRCGRAFTTGRGRGGGGVDPASVTAVESPCSAAS